MPDVTAPELTELDIARLMAVGELPSPQKFGDMLMWCMRVTGTGTAYRSSLDEFVYRRPENYLTDEFLQRCNGLAVIFEHPEGKTLNSKEFADRVIGSIMLAYIQGDEVWGIAKIYDAASNDLMLRNVMSTSPTVVFSSADINSTIVAENGDTILIEGKPRLLDHLAVCEAGVWDKGREPTGVLNNSQLGASEMTPEEMKAKADAEAAEEAKAKADAETKDTLSKIADSVATLCKRMDSMEQMGQTAATAADKAKADAEAEKEEEKAKADAQARADAEAATAARIDAIQAQLPKALSDADYNQLAATQSQADSVAHAFGDSAPRPMAGETPLAYRKRCVAKFKEHSPTWKGIPMEAISDAVIDVAEKQVYSDSMAAALRPVMADGAGLREIISRTRAGHEVSNFVGKISDFTSAFKSPVSKRATKFNKTASA